MLKQERKKTSSSYQPDCWIQNQIAAACTGRPMSLKELLFKMKISS